MTAALIIQYVLAALQVAQAAGPAIAEIETLMAQLKTMQSTNSDPTPQQWATQSQTMQSALAALLAAKPA